MAYKLSIADIVELPIKFNVNDGGKSTWFNFLIRAKRLPQAELRAIMKDDIPTAEFLKRHVVGWRGQTLVMGANDEPAEFNDESFSVMLSLVGMEGLMLGAYLRAMGVEAPAEKAKN